MPKIRHEQLDDAAQRFLDGSDLDRKVGQVVQLVTADADGACHVALLSVGEVLAPDHRSVVLALHATSSTTANLRERGRGLLFLVLDGTCIDVDLRVRPVGQQQVRGMEVALFVGDVTGVWIDEVGYARITSGITFELLREGEVVDRWRETVDLMRGLPAR